MAYNEQPILGIDFELPEGEQLNDDMLVELTNGKGDDE